MKYRSASVRQLMSDELFRTLVDTFPDAVTMTDLEGKITFASPVTLEIHRFESEDEILGTDTVSLIAPVDRERAASNIRRTLKEGFVRGEVYTLLRKDGTEFTGALNASLIRDSKGKPVSFIATTRDISEKRKSDERIRDSERNLRSIINAITESVLLIETSGKVVAINETTAQRLGVEVDDLIGRNIYDFIPPDLAVSRTARAAEVIESGMPRHFEDYRGDRLIRNTIYPVKDTDGAVTHLAIYGADISDFRMTEDERMRLEAQVQKARKFESLGVLSGGIAHDFNNLLTGVMGNAQLAIRKVEPGSIIYRHLEKIIDSARRAADLSLQILAYTGKVTLNLESIDISELVEEMSDQLKSDLPPNTTIEFSLEADLPEIGADLEQIRQILPNLISNAAEAIGEEEGTISVSTGQWECGEDCISDEFTGNCVTGEKYLFLEVSDTGCGMDEETLSRIFDPFFTTKVYGRGLGLSAVLGVTLAHKGAVRVLSEPACGTSIRILLPLIRQEGWWISRKPEEAGEWKGSGTVLIIDDEEQIRSVASEMLETLGFDVLTASSGPLGLAQFRRHADQVVLVLLDMVMPYMSGVEVLDEIRRINNNVPIIFSSGYDSTLAARHFGGEEYTGFLQKPYEYEALEQKVREILAG